MKTIKQLILLTVALAMTTACCPCTIDGLSNTNNDSPEVVLSDQPTATDPSANQ